MRFPERIYGFRWLLILWAVVTFVWLSREDSEVLGVVILGVWGTVLICGSWVLNRIGGKTVSLLTALLSMALIGAIMGITASLLTAGLMFFKNVRHAHIFPDYPFELIGAMLQRAPMWGLAGGLFGVAIGLLWIAFTPHHPLQSGDLNSSE